MTALEGDVYEDAPQPTRVASPETAVLEAECHAKGLVFWSPDTPHLYDVVVSLVAEDGNIIDPDGFRFMGCRTLQTKEQDAKARVVDLKVAK